MKILAFTYCENIICVGKENKIFKYIFAEGVRFAEIY